MSVFIARAYEHFSFLPQLSSAAPWTAFRPAIFSAIRMRAVSCRAYAIWVFSVITLVSAVVYVVSMNTILFEGRRAASLERVLRDEQRITQVLLAERAALRSPSVVKARAATMGMTEVLQIHFVSETDAIAAKERFSGDPF